MILVDSRNGPSTVEVFHRDSPCSPLGQDTVVAAPALRDIMACDESRVRSIQAQLVPSSRSLGGNGPKLPVQPGDSLDIADYVVNLCLGTLMKPLFLAFDSGSSLMWTQCKPCSESCYQQKDLIFDPSSSTTYSNISCTSRKCAMIIDATSNPPSCVSTTCFYMIMYGNRSYTEGS